MNQPLNRRGGTGPTESDNSIEHIFQAWDAALAQKNVEAALALYAEGASIESPLVQHLMGSDVGICQGKDEIRNFVEIVFHRTPPMRKHFRSGYFTDGRWVIWEYPRATPDGEQMDLVEVMEVADGLIQNHRVYWGWYGLAVLARDEYRR